MGRDLKLRTIILHDPELDDMNTVLRYLLYSNMFETEGIIYASSQFHWKGDGRGTLFEGTSEHSRYGIGPIASWRWDEGSNFMHEAVEAYAQAYPNLSVHAEGYPHPDALRACLLDGNVAFPGDMSADSPGSIRIRGCILDDKPGKLYLLTGAGHSTIGRALKSISEKYGEGREWTQIRRKIAQKVVIQSFGDQDGVYADYIAKEWPDIEFREVATMIWGYFARKVVQPEDMHMLSAAWTKEHVSSVGPLGGLYLTWGDGRQMHRNDIADYFGFSGVTVDQLKALGYIPWCGEPLEPGAWISEGDTSMYMNLLDNGLDAHVDASYGGWGGRGGMDVAPDGRASRDYASTRWFGAAQRDFAARLKWSVTPEYAAANHAPVVSLVETEDRFTVRPGQEVVLRAKAKDPDGDHVTGCWWQYVEAGTYPRKVGIDNSMGALFGAPGPKPMELPKFSYPFRVPAPSAPELQCLAKDEVEIEHRFTVPTDAVNGQTIHFIAEFQDHVAQPLTAYRRVVMTVERLSDSE